MQHGLAHRLAGNRTCIDAGAADYLPLLDDAHFLAGLGALNGSPLARRARTDHQEIELLHSCPLESENNRSPLIAALAHRGSSAAVRLRSDECAWRAG